MSRVSWAPTTGQAGTRLVWNMRVVLQSSREARPHVVPGKPTAARVLGQTQMQGVRSQTADLGLAQSGKRHRLANKAYQSARFPLKPQVDNCEANGLPKASKPGVFANRRQVQRHCMTIFSPFPGYTRGPQRLELCGQLCSKKIRTMSCRSNAEN